MRFLVLVGLVGYLVGHSAEASDLSVSSPDKAELVSLSAALKEVSHADCGPITSSGPGYTLPVASCISPGVRRLMQTTSKVTGPNCFNFANIVAGLQDVVRYISEQESSLILDPASGYCSQLSRAPRAGDYAVISSGQHLIHAYVYLSNRFAFSKNGPDPSEPWGISSVSKINSAYLVPGIDGGRSTTSYYYCAKPPEKLPPESKNIWTLNEQLAKSMEALIFIRPVSAAVLSRIQSDMNAFGKAITPAAITQLQTANPQNKELLASIYGQLHVLENADLSSPEFARLQNTYLDIVSGLVDKTRAKLLLSDDVANPENEMIYSYCDAHKNLPAICNRN